MTTSIVVKMEIQLNGVSYGLANALLTVINMLKINLLSARKTHEIVLFYFFNIISQRMKDNSSLSADFFLFDNDKAFQID